MEEMVLAVADMTFGSRQTVLGVATNAIFQFLFLFFDQMSICFLISHFKNVVFKLEKNVCKAEASVVNVVIVVVA